MKLKLQLNIGTDDAQKLGLKKTRSGEIVEVSDDVATILLRNLWAVEPNAIEAIDDAARGAGLKSKNSE